MRLPETYSAAPGILGLLRGTNIPKRPFAAGSSAGNYRINSAAARVGTRIAARKTGTLKYLYIRVKVSAGGAAPTSYWDGYDGGQWTITWYAAKADGSPDTTVLATETFRPLTKAYETWADKGLAANETIRLAPNIAVTKGDLLWVVIANTTDVAYVGAGNGLGAPNNGIGPTGNYASQNFLYVGDVMTTGLEISIQGAQARNELSTAVTDSYYGLDPREIVAGSNDSGATWNMPGNVFGPLAKNLPTYVQEFVDGTLAGQEYYSCGGSTIIGGLQVVQTYTAAPAGTVSWVGGYLNAPGDTFTATLRVNGTIRGSAVLSGAGHTRSPIPDVVLAGGETVTITATPNVTGVLRDQYSTGGELDALLGHGTGYKWYASTDANRAIPLFPLYSAGGWA